MRPNAEARPRYIPSAGCSDLQLCLDPFHPLFFDLSTVASIRSPRRSHAFLNMPRLNMSLLCSLLLASHLTIAQQFTPRGDLEQRYGTRLQRRIACEPATPDVSEDAVRPMDPRGRHLQQLINISFRCSQMPATRTRRTASAIASTRCTLVAFRGSGGQALTEAPSVLYAQDSATETCAHFYTLYNDCLVANNYSETACADSRSGYVYCSNYTYVMLRCLLSDIIIQPPSSLSAVLFSIKQSSN